MSEADSDVRVENIIDKKSGKTIKRRVIYVPFKQAVSGTTLVNVRMEKSLPRGVKSFSAPLFNVLGTRVQRGYLVVASD